MAVETTSARRQQQALPFVVLGAIVLLGASVLIAVLVSGAARAGLGLEVAKVAMQVIAVAGIGSAATIAVFTYQERARATAEELREADAATRRQEEWRRLDRQRQDDLVNTAVTTTIRAYNSVKSVRRRLRAASAHGSTSQIDADDYDAHLRELIEQQLVFEELKRMSALIGGSWVRSQFDRIEKSLNLPIDEYEKNRQRVRDAGSASLDSLPALGDLLGRRSFYAGVAKFTTDTIAGMQEWLLRPASAQDEPHPVIGPAQSPRDASETSGAI